METDERWAIFCGVGLRHVLHGYGKLRIRRAAVALQSSLASPLLHVACAKGPLPADNLAKRNWPHDDLCSLCQRDDENCHHLFVACDYTAAVWRSIKRWCNESFPIPADGDAALADWWLATRCRFQKSYRADFDCAFMLICWLIWKERNARIFQHVSKLLDQLAEDIKDEIAVWRVAGVFSQFRE